MVHHGDEVEARFLGGFRLRHDVVEEPFVWDPRIRVIRHVEAEESSHIDGNPAAPDTIPSHMSWKNAILVGLALVVLMYGTVAVFVALDRDSHSASDTLRPFILTMGPVWALSVAAATVLLRRRS